MLIVNGLVINMIII